MRIRWPLPIAHFLNCSFVRFFNIDMSIAEKPIEQYRTIEDLFTRKLRPDARSFSATFCAPAEGVLSNSGPVTDGSFVQAKGLHYSLDTLVFGHQVGGPLGCDFGWAATVYLAPQNYHRVHAPSDCVLHAIRYFPGQLWPVNRGFVRGMPRLFCRNERLVFDFSLDDADSRFYLVMVGALNVGRMSTPFWPTMITNDVLRQALPEPHALVFEQPSKIVKGAEIGTFALGSTVVLAFSRKVMKRFSFVKTYDKMPILLGQPLTAAEAPYGNGET